MKKVVSHAVHEVTSVTDIDEDDFKYIPPSDGELNDAVKKGMAAFVKEKLEVDDVVCTSLKHFITEEEAEE